MLPGCPWISHQPHGSAWKAGTQLHLPSSPLSVLVPRCRNVSSPWPYIEAELSPKHIIPILIIRLKRQI